MEKLLTVAEAAPLVHMSRQGLYAAIRAKQFPALHVGRLIRIPQSSVQQWIQEQMQRQEEGTTNQHLPRLL
jgi:excisionase family DNA binding protein